jgi:hypothetical protein
MKYSKILICMTVLVCLAFQAYAQSDYLGGSTIAPSGDWNRPDRSMIDPGIAGMLQWLDTPVPNYPWYTASDAFYSQPYSYTTFSPYTEYYVSSGSPVVGGIISNPTKFDISQKTPSRVYYGAGVGLPYSQYASIVPSKTNDLWIQGATNWTQYVVSPVGTWLQLIAYAPVAGPAGFYETTQTDTTSTKYKTYQFNQGYNTMNFNADKVGRHMLNFVVNSQPSNTVIVDVFAQAPAVSTNPVHTAAPTTETHQLGPYTVSFDMNTDMSYQIQTEDPGVYPFATIYPLVIKTDNTTGASISITQYNNLTPSILGVNEEIAALRMALRGINVTAPEKMAIDNKNGFLLSGIPFTGTGNAPSGFMFYQAQYWLDSKDCECGPVSVGTVLVNIASTYPQNVTESLLSSIHVAESQMPSTQAQDQNVSITPSSNNVPEETFGFVEGRVYNQRNGEAVASAEITVDYIPTRIMTDAHGNYQVKVQPGQHSIGAQSSNHSVMPSSVMVYRNQTTKLDLEAVSK